MPHFWCQVEMAHKQRGVKKKKRKKRDRDQPSFLERIATRQKKADRLINGQGGEQVKRSPHTNLKRGPQGLCQLSTNKLPFVMKKRIDENVN